MSARRVELTFSQKLWDSLEKARGHEPRASFVKRALESALGGVEESEHSPLDQSVSTPTRAPVVVEDVDAFAAGEVMDPPERKPRLTEAQSVKAQVDWMMDRQAKLNKRGKK